MPSVDVKAVAVFVTSVVAGQTFVDVGATRAVAKPTRVTGTTEPANTVETGGHDIATGLARGALVDINALSITEHESNITGTVK